ncbi:hypothetical protein [Parolsenella catena]
MAIIVTHEIAFARETYRGIPVSVEFVPKVCTDEHGYDAVQSIDMM